VVTADGIGEWACTTVGTFSGVRARYRRIRSTQYPNSLGLLYSAFTQRCGFKPNEDEHILMGLAALGEPRHVEDIYRDFVVVFDGDFRLRRNVHRGIGDWLPGARDEDLAASMQKVTEDVVVDTCRWARQTTGLSRLVLMGGLALNCLANSRVARECGFDEISILPNPGDAGSSLGAAAAYLGLPLQWEGPFLGTEIIGPYPVRAALNALLAGRVIGIANGRAEFGPRALGNRSLLCDPRGADVQEKMNAIKGREPFRPFAPVVLEEHATAHFSMPVRRSPYMQFVSRCLAPDATPAITHVDGTSRVQTLSAIDNQGLHELTTAFHAATGCPILLNTSLNVKGEPLVNGRADALRFSAATGVEVL
jgi:carbamoyltransferase